MEFESIYIEIDGAEAEDIYPDMIRLEVETDERMAAMFRLRLPLKAEPDGSWAYLDDERFRPWKTVTVKAGFEGNLEELISGYITSLRGLRVDEFKARAVAIVCSQKSIAVAVPIWASVFAEQYPLSLIPAIIFHFFQILVDVAIANYWAKKEDDRGVPAFVKSTSSGGRV